MKSIISAIILVIGLSCLILGLNLIVANHIIENTIIVNNKKHKKVLYLGEYHCHNTNVYIGNNAKYGAYNYLILTNGIVRKEFVLKLSTVLPEGKYWIKYQFRKEGIIYHCYMHELAGYKLNDLRSFDISNTPQYKLKGKFKFQNDEIQETELMINQY